MTPVVHAEHVTKSFHTAGADVATTVLRGASISVLPGEVVALMGPSGAGKSTFLHILATLDTADAGTIDYVCKGQRYDVVRASQSTITTLRHSSIGIVFQFHHLLPEFTALENVMMPGLIRGDAEADVLRRAQDLLQSVGMEHRLKHMPRELSGGEQQRVAIARALVNHPQILFADEPTGNLDSDHAHAITDVLLTMSATMGTACVIATHSSELAQRAHRVIRMVDGLCLEDERG